MFSKHAHLKKNKNKKNQDTPMISYDFHPGAWEKRRCGEPEGAGRTYDKD